MTTSPSTLDDLGIQGCMALGALLLAHEQRTLVAPTRRMTLAYLVLLREHGIIQTPWPADRWQLDPTAEQTPIEQLQWRLAWSAYHRVTLLPAIEYLFESIQRDDYWLACLHRLWSDLAAGEAEHFLEAQLTKHHFDPVWAQDLAFVIRDFGFQMSIAQWRYCCWAATRYGASLAIQLQTTRSTDIRESIYAELRRRAMRVGSGDWANCGFVPSNSRPANAAGRIFLAALAPIGQAFWTLPPSFDALAMSLSVTKHGFNP